MGKTVFLLAYLLSAVAQNWEVNFHNAATCAQGGCAAVPVPGATCPQEPCDSPDGLNTGTGAFAQRGLQCMQASNFSNPTGKPGIRLLSNVGTCPLNAEALPESLYEDITTYPNMFVRLNGNIPERATRQDLSFPTPWRLRVYGDPGTTTSELSLTMDDLRNNYQVYTRQYTIECAGNGRAGFAHIPGVRPPGGNQWTLGAVHSGQWTGVLLRDVLESVGVQPPPASVYVAYESEDRQCIDPEKEVISRGVPIQKAMDPYTMLAFELNGAPIPTEHGFPLRLIAPGFPGSASGKFLTGIRVRDQVHDGPKMTGTAYTVPKYPTRPGDSVETENLKIIETMPVKSVITHPTRCSVFVEGAPVRVQGKAWSGAGNVMKVEVSWNQGQDWVTAQLTEPANMYAWQKFSYSFVPPTPGYFEIWARATDVAGRTQPMILPNWNSKGYLNNAAMNVAITVTPSTTD